MSKRTITYQIKLPLTLTIILGLIAFGLIANVLKPILNIDKAFAAGDIHRIAICDLKGQCAEIRDAAFSSAPGKAIGVYNFGR